jgi:hypothetical protein
MIIPAKVSCTSCGHEGFEIEFLRCIQCLERFCLSPLDPCIRGCKCTSPRPHLSTSPSHPIYFQQELRQNSIPSNLL